MRGAVVTIDAVHDPLLPGHWPFLVCRQNSVVEPSSLVLLTQGIVCWVESVAMYSICAMCAPWMPLR